MGHNSDAGHSDETFPTNGRKDLNLTGNSCNGCLRREDVRPAWAVQRPDDNLRGQALRRIDIRLLLLLTRSRPQGGSQPYTLNVACRSGDGKMRRKQESAGTSLLPVRPKTATPSRRNSPLPFNSRIDRRTWKCYRVLLLLAQPQTPLNGLA